MQPMVVRKHAQELILGMNRDPIFGPAILFGAGGMAVEVMDDTAIALPPLDDVLAGDLIERTRIGRLLAGFRDRQPADRTGDRLGAQRAVADDRRLPLHRVGRHQSAARRRRGRRSRWTPASRSIRRPWNSKAPIPPLASGPIRRGGEGHRRRTMSAITSGRSSRLMSRLYPDFLAKVSPDDIRLRFLAPRKSFADDMLKRLTQLDYDRDMAFVALEADGALGGSRPTVLRSRPRDRRICAACPDDLQGHGLGWALLARSSTTPRRKESG